MPRNPDTPIDVREDAHAWHAEHEPFPAFLTTCTDLDLVFLRYEAKQAADLVTQRAVDVELARRIHRKGLV